MLRRNGLTLRFVALMVVVSCVLPFPMAAHPATKLFVGHSAHLTAEIPAGWTVDPTGVFDYFGADGFVANQRVDGRTLDEACRSLSASPRFDATPTVGEARWSGQVACRVEGRIAGRDTAALVVPHPHPFELVGHRYAYAALIASQGDLNRIAATLDFSPERVTPEAYLTSVIDIVEARAYWADGVDWELARREVLASVEGLPTLEMAQGALQAIVQKLRHAGDNHSLVVLADQPNRLEDAVGFGMLVGGLQVVALYEGGPADRAGVRVGDLIEAVDGRPLEPTPIPVDPARLGGPDPAERWGASVELTMRRPDEPAAIGIIVEQGSYSLYAPPTGRRLAGDVGYIQVPLFRVSDKATDFVATAHDIFASVDESPTCGWVVDLRLNQGGSFYPMIAGIGPILGEGPFFGSRRADSSQTWVTYQDGRISVDGQVVAEDFTEQPYALLRPNPPVAVLTGPLTGSSGEVSALAFVGRPESRLFGEPTAGLTTVNTGAYLFDGSLLLLAAAAMTDRTGATHLAGVEPDELIATDWTPYGTEDDPVLKAAQAWLNDQPTCMDAMSKSS